MVSINLTTSHSNLFLHHFTTASPISFFLQRFSLCNIEYHNSQSSTSIIVSFLHRQALYDIWLHWIFLVPNFGSFCPKHPKDYTCKSWRSSMNSNSCHPSHRCQYCFTGTLPSRSSHSKSLKDWLPENSITKHKFKMSCSDSNKVIGQQLSSPINGPPVDIPYYGHRKGKQIS